MTDRVIRHTKRLPQSRCSPFTNGTTDDVSKEKEQKEEAVRLGVELSLFMAEAMFILSDDRRSMTGLAHIVSTLEIGCLVKPSVFEQYNQELKKLEENLGEAIESEILPLWKSLFETNSQVIKLDKTINRELLRPLLNELNKEICARSLRGYYWFVSLEDF
ncbi:BnaC05g51710D [Brassica napus]|uniref:BnaC05g51710D protein n=1 Tax=Brassica napus TaxID=3708 RepID=A0A078JR34_BRANA|nr:BnaC05g51710D [Brassica napus]